MKNGKGTSAREILKKVGIDEETEILEISVNVEKNEIGDGLEDLKQSGTGVGTPESKSSTFKSKGQSQKIWKFPILDTFTRKRKPEVQNVFAFGSRCSRDNYKGVHPRYRKIDDNPDLGPTTYFPDVINKETAFLKNLTENLIKLKNLRRTQPLRTIPYRFMNPNRLEKFQFIVCKPDMTPTFRFWNFPPGSREIEYDPYSYGHLKKTDVIDMEVAIQTKVYEIPSKQKNGSVEHKPSRI